MMIDQLTNLKLEYNLVATKTSIPDVKTQNSDNSNM